MTKRLISLDFGSTIVSLEFKLQDMWVGIYWHNTKWSKDIYICMLPTLPIHIRYVDLNI